MTEPQAAAAQQSAPLTGHKLWPAELLRARLIAADAPARLQALAMSVQPGAPVDACIDAIVRCAQMANDDATMLHLVTVALGAATPARLNSAALELLSSLMEAKHADHVRIFAAHALFRLKAVPASAFSRLSALLVHNELGARQMALNLLSLVAKPAAGAITQLVAATPAKHWTTEALAALAKSAGDSADNQSSVEQFLMRALPSAAIVPTGIAGYTALAQMKPNGAATTVLARIASSATDAEHWRAALTALSTLGESAHSAAAELGKALVAIDNPEREEALCRVLVGLRVAAADVPLPRVSQRIQSGPDRSAAAHCMLLALHAKKFAAGSKVVRTRYETASAALKPVLAKTHLALAGTDLGASNGQRS